MKYTLHRIQISEYNPDPGFAMRNPDGEAFHLYDEEDMRSQYEMLKAYFEHGEISDEPVEIEELEGGWASLADAIYLARQYSAKTTDEHIIATVRRLAERGQLGHSHKSIYGGWWLDRLALDKIFFRCVWGERKPVPQTDKEIIYVENIPFGPWTLADELEQGAEFVHQHEGVYYKLYLDEQDRIVGIYDEEHYRLLAELKAYREGNRVKILAGQYQVGDLLDGREIKGLGKVWGEGKLQGELWQPCARTNCDNEPSCAMCERCKEHCFCDRQEYQYAYFTERK